MPNHNSDASYTMCGSVKKGEQFLWSCPVKQPMWQTLTQRFFEQPSLLSFEQISHPQRLTAEPLAQWNLEPFAVIVYGVLSLQKLHRKCTFDDSPSWPKQAE